MSYGQHPRRNTPTQKHNMEKTRKLIAVNMSSAHTDIYDGISTEVFRC